MGALPVALILFWVLSMPRVRPGQQEGPWSRANDADSPFDTEFELQLPNGL